MDIVYFDMGLNGEDIGRITIELYRDCFPDAVENFLRIAEGSTSRSEPRNGYTRLTKRSYEGTRFFRKVYNQYIMGGDIYQNNGTDAGTIFNDQPIPEIVPDYFIPHDKSGLISVVSYPSESQGKLYDSTFMITLGPTPELNTTQVVIGSVIRGQEILTRINNSIVPIAGRRYPLYYIIKSGIVQSKVARNLVPKGARTDEIIVYNTTSDGEIIVSQELDSPKGLEGARKIRSLPLRIGY